MATDPLWYKNAIIYELHVRCFYDSDEDGIGDFKGLTQKLDYLQDLGVTAIWLLPFYPSPLKDDGYDIADYYDINPSYGTLADFRFFLKEAHARGLRVITELVINHTSDQHPWFQRARYSKKGSTYRNFYVWNKTSDKYKDARIIFQDFETSNWTFDPIAGEYYWHRFYSHQPDLNFENPAVEKEILKILSFWLKMGVDGIRLDAVPYLYEKEDTICENLEETHAFLKRLRAFVDQNFADKMLLAEANQWPEEAAKYFGEGDECHMAFHFPVMPRLFISIQLEDSFPIIEILHQTPQIPQNCSWALFLRNHDELTLEMVTDEDRDYMFKVYARESIAKLNVGIRHRLFPLLQKDRRKIELMNILLFSLEGTPIIYYGDEMGMGDNIYLGDRQGVRTPMQWSSERNAGFSKANPQRLYLPPIIDPEYHYEVINVETQNKNPFSLLRWTKQLTRLRKRFKAFSFGQMHFLTPENRKVLVFLRTHEGEDLLIVSNLSRFAQYVELDLSKYQGFNLIELFSGERFPNITDAPYLLTLGPYGYYWFSLQKEEAGFKREIPHVDVRGDERRLFALHFRPFLENYLLQYLKEPELEHIKIYDHIKLHFREFPNIDMLIVKLFYSNGLNEKQHFFLSIEDAETVSQEKAILEWQHPKLSTRRFLCDASEKKELFLLMNVIIEGEKKIKGEAGEVRGYSIDGSHPSFFTFGSEQAKTWKERHWTLYPANAAYIKSFRELREQSNVDLRVRLALSAHTPFRGFLPLLGYLQYKQADETMVFAEKISPYSAEFTLFHPLLEEAIFFLGKKEKEMPLKPVSWIALSQDESLHRSTHFTSTTCEIMKALGYFTASYHQALSSPDLPKEFQKLPYTPFFQRSLYQSIRKKILDAMKVLRRNYATLPQEQKNHALELIEAELKLVAALEPLLNQKFSAERIHHHGNYVLENLLFTGKEFFILHFEGKSPYLRNGYVDVVSIFHCLVEVGYVAVEKELARGLIAEHERDEANRIAFNWAHFLGATFLHAYLSKMEHSLTQEESYFLLKILLIERAAEKIAYNKSPLNPSIDILWAIFAELK